MPFLVCAFTYVQCAAPSAQIGRHAVRKCAVGTARVHLLQLCPFFYASCTLFGFVSIYSILWTFFVNNVVWDILVFAVLSLPLSLSLSLSLSLVLRLLSRTVPCMHPRYPRGARTCRLRSNTGQDGVRV